MIYLASPYSHPNPDIRHHRFVAVCRRAGRMITWGLPVFSPIAHGHAIAQHAQIDGTDWQTWSAHCLAFLDRATEMHVLQLPGWQDSIGVQAEIAHALARRIPILYIEDITPQNPWLTESITCHHCGHAWVAVHPRAESLECPTCHQRTAAPSELQEPHA